MKTQYAMLKRKWIKYLHGVVEKAQLLNKDFVHYVL